MDPTDYNNANRYHLFKSIMPDVSSSTVLDWGGNSGNLLRYSEGDITERLYTSVDVDAERLELGSITHPDASFIHYDRWNSAYNHNGSSDFNFPDINKEQDYIYSFSIFTHTDYNEFIKTFEWLDTFNYKCMAHSMLDINHTDRIEWFYNKRKKEYGDCVDFVKVSRDPTVNIMTVYDNDQIIVNELRHPHINSHQCLVFYNMDWVCNDLKERGHDVTVQRPEPEKQPFIVKKG